MEGLAITVRAATKSDITRMSEILHDAVGFTCCNDYSADQVKAWQDKAGGNRWQELWCSELTFYVAEVSSEAVVGFSSINPAGYIHSMFVDYRYLRKGVATALLKVVQAHALAEGVAVLTSDVSITAKPFFESMGFGVVGEQEVTVGCIALRNFSMSKHL